MERYSANRMVQSAQWPFGRSSSTLDRCSAISLVVRFRSSGRRHHSFIVRPVENSNKQSGGIETCGHFRRNRLARNETLFMNRSNSDELWLLLSWLSDSTHAIAALMVLIVTFFLIRKTTFAWNLMITGKGSGTSFGYHAVFGMFAIAMMMLALTKIQRIVSPHARECEAFELEVIPMLSNDGNNKEDYSYRSRLQYCWALVVISTAYLIYVSTADDQYITTPPYSAYIIGSMLMIITGIICTVLTSIMIYKSNQSSERNKPSASVTNKFWERRLIQLALLSFGFAAFSFIVFLVYSKAGN